MCESTQSCNLLCHLPQGSCWLKKQIRFYGTLPSNKPNLKTANLQVHA